MQFTTSLAVTLIGVGLLCNTALPLGQTAQYTTNDNAAAQDIMQRYKDLNSWSLKQGKLDTKAGTLQVYAKKIDTRTFTQPWRIQTSDSESEYTRPFQVTIKKDTFGTNDVVLYIDKPTYVSVLKGLTGGLVVKSIITPKDIQRVLVGGKNPILIIDGDGQAAVTADQ